MASFVPSSFNDAWEKGKGQFNEYKKPVAKWVILVFQFGID